MRAFPRRAFPFLFCLLGAVSLAACESDEPGSDTGVDGGSVGELTYHEHLRPLIEESCAGCHTDGGAAPMVLDTWEGFSTWGAAAVEAVESGTMPPWTPDPDCRPLQGDRSLTADEIDVFSGWLADGSREGAEADYVAPEATDVEFGVPDWDIAPAVEYTPSLALPDDYRCFPLDYEFEEEALIGAFDIVPGDSATVHHVLIYPVGPAGIDTMEALDAAEDGPGYSCFGGPGAGSRDLLAAWIPGSPPTQFPGDSAIRIVPGSRLVMQVHYSTAGITDPAELRADRTRLRLWENADAEELLVVLGFVDREIPIPAGEAEVTHRSNHIYPIDARLVMVAPHMHNLGTEISIRHAEAGCLVDIPDWDFNWQQYYFFEDDSTVEIEVGTELELTCTYNNSTENQPLVNGLQLEPRDVAWGDGTFDEMCVAFVGGLIPNYPSNGGLCGPFDACIDGCIEDGGVDCFMSCALAGGGSCLSCVSGGLQGCVLDHCPLEGLLLQTCLSDCGPLYSCSSVTCREEFGSLIECVKPHALEGACDEGLAACDASMGE